jgi:hypothetical protein
VRYAAAKPRVNAEKPRFFINAALMRKNNAHIKHSGEWPACGLKTCGIFYENMKQEKIYVSIETGETSSGQMLPRLLV